MCVGIDAMALVRRPEDNFVDSFSSFYLPKN